jgi:hypothetical protein
LNWSSEGGIVSTAKSRKQKHLQRISWSESLLVVRLSTECSSIKELRHRLWSDLPQNSLNTRRRCASTILARFFPDKISNSSPVVSAWPTRMRLCSRVSWDLYCSLLSLCLGCYSRSVCGFCLLEQSWPKISLLAMGRKSAQPM